MNLELISPSESGTAAVRDKINAVITVANELASDLVVLDTRLSAQLEEAFAGLPASHPGASPDGFTSSLAGQNMPALDPAGIVGSPIGDVYLLGGAGVVATRAAIPIEPDTFYALRVRFQRRTDPTDPNNHAVDVGVQWLDAAGGDLGRSLIRRWSALTRASGPQSLTARVPSVRDASPAILPPARAAAWRPYLRTYGSDGETSVEVLAATDVTYAGVYAPDVAALAARMGSLEGVIAAGIPVATPILPSYPVEQLPPAGTRGRQAWATNGRAPNAAGLLEGAGAGTGVEVADNGTKWVISGTNQAVQA